MSSPFAFRVAPRTVAAIAALAGVSASLALNLPGHLDYDSIVQLLEGRTGAYSNYHPPVMAWMLGLGDALVPGASLFVIFDTVLAYAVLASLFWLMPRPGWRGVTVFVLALCLPQMLLFQGIVLKDILFADAGVAGFVCLAHAAVRWRHPRVRFALLAAAAVFITLAVLTRQNGLAILPCAVVAVGATAWTCEPSTDRRRRTLAAAGAFAGACAIMGLAAHMALQSRVVTHRAEAEMVAKAQVYDIIGLVKSDPGLPLPVLEARAPELAKLIRSGGPSRYTPASINPLLAWAPLGWPTVRAEAAVGDQWLALILNRPLDYLALRARVFAWVALSRHPAQCAIYTVGVDGPAPQMTALGLKPRLDRRDVWLDDDYASRFIGSGFLHPLYALVGVACAVVLIRRGRPVDLVVIALLGASAIYAATFFVISIACEYRYLYVVDLAAIAAAIHVFASLEPRRPTPSPAAEGERMPKRGRPLESVRRSGPRDGRRPAPD